MRIGILAVALLLARAVDSAAQAPACQAALATLNVPPATYAQLNAAPFEQRVYVYAPANAARGKAGFQPFQMWIVEGVYGKPFVQTSGGLDQAGFDKLRGSQNVRATAVNVARGDGSDGGPFRLGRNTYVMQVLRVNPAGSDGVQVRICR